MKSNDDERDPDQPLAEDSWTTSYSHAVRMHDDQRDETIYLRMLFDEAPTAYIVTDPEFIIRDANKAAQQLTRRRLENLVGKPLAVVVPASDLFEFRAMLGEVHGGARISRPVRVINRGIGEEETTLIAKLVERDGEPGLIFCVFCTTDSEQADMM